MIRKLQELDFWIEELESKGVPKDDILKMFYESEEANKAAKRPTEDE